MSGFDQTGGSQALGRPAARRRSLISKAGLAIRATWKASVDLMRYCRLRPRYPDHRLSYDDYWDLRPDVKMGSRFSVMASLVGRGTRILDIGCGEGTLLEHLIRTREVEGSGIDVSERAVTRATERGLTARVADATRGELPAGPFDHVICGEFLEHIPEPEQVLIAVRSVVRGSVIVSLPNVGYYADRCRLLLGRFPVQWLDHPAEHLRFFTVKDFVDCAHDLGFRVRSVRAASGFPVLMRWWPNLFAQQVVYELEVRHEPCGR